MTVLQLFGGTVILISRLTAADLPPEPAFAFYLAFLILVLTGHLLTGRIIKAAVIIIKAAFCFLLMPFSVLPLLLVPSIGFELIDFIRGIKARLFLRLLWYALFLSIITLLPPELYLLFFGLWGITVFVSWKEDYNKNFIGRLKERVGSLERELDVLERRNISLEKAGSDQELMIKYQERDRIAQELHDELGHTITGSIMRLEAAGVLFKDDPARAEEMMGRVSETLREGLTSIRRSLKSIKPEPSVLGLKTIQSMLSEFQAAYGRSAEIIVEGNILTIPALLWKVLESNVQEGLTNMLKHSSGRSFTCRINVLNRVFKMEYRDDGIVKGPVKKGMGLEGIESRTGEAGGTVLIDTSQGFSVIMLFKRDEQK